MILSACTSVSEAGVPRTSAPPSTVASPTTTAAPSTPSTNATFQIAGVEADPDLELLVQAWYGAAAAGREATAHVGTLDDRSRVAVIISEADVTFAVADPSWRIVGGWWPSMGRQAELGEFPKIVAVIGSDARPGHDPLTAQADSIHFVGLDDSGNASVLGLPRDAWVPVPGAGNMKATSSLARGGPETMMATFSDLTELQFDGYVLTGFEGFIGLIDVLGGLEIDVPVSLHDKWAKADLEAGPQVLGPADALAFARVRKTIAGGDFTRKWHGGLALLAAGRMVQRLGPSAVPAILENSQPHYYTDMPPEDLLLFIGAMMKADLDEAPNVVAPGKVGTTSGGASIVRLADGAFDLFADLEDGRLDDVD